jgi:hypothetical protein
MTVHVDQRKKLTSFEKYHKLRNIFYHNSVFRFRFKDNAYCIKTVAQSMYCFVLIVVLY